MDVGWTACTSTASGGDINSLQVLRAPSLSNITKSCVETNALTLLTV